MEVVHLSHPAEKYVLDVKDKTKIIDRINGDVDEVRPYFDEKLEKRNRNFEFYKGNQWTDADKDAHLRQYRNALVFNEIQNKVEHLMGTQTQTRMDIKCLGREKQDEMGAELLTQMVKWVEQVNGLEYVESEVFIEGIIGGVGISQVRWELEDVDKGYPAIEKIPFEQMYWDRNAIKMDLSDARWYFREQYVTKFTALELFPYNKKEIDRATSINTNSSIYNYRYRRRYSNLYHHRYSDESRELVRLGEYYERVKTYKYTVADEFRGSVITFDNEEEADAYYNGLIDGYTKNGEVLINSDMSSQVTMVTNTIDTIYQTILIGDELISHEPLLLPDSPYSMYFAYFVEGDWWGFVDLLIDPQRVTNEFFSQWVYQLGAASKNAITVMPSLLKRGYTIEDLRREFAKTAPVIPVTSHQAINPLPNIPVNPELFQGVMFAREWMNDAAGGKNVQGLQQNAAESGRAVIARAEQGGIVRLPLFDRLRFWKNNVALRVVWYIKNYMTSSQILRVVGYDDIQYIPLDNGLLDTLKEIKIDIIIDEAIKSETIKERYFQQMKETLSMLPGMPPEIMTQILLEFSSIPESKKSEIMSKLEFYKEYMGSKAKAMQQEKMQKEVQDSLYKRMLKQEVEQSDEVVAQIKDTESQKKLLKEKLTELEKLQQQLQIKQDEINKMSGAEEQMGQSEDSQMSDEMPPMDMNSLPQ